MTNWKRVSLNCTKKYFNQVLPSRKFKLQNCRRKILITSRYFRSWRHSVLFTFPYHPSNHKALNYVGGSQLISNKPMTLVCPRRLEKLFIIIFWSLDELYFNLTLKNNSHYDEHYLFLCKPWIFLWNGILWVLKQVSKSQKRKSFNFFACLITAMNVWGVCNRMLFGGRECLFKLFFKYPKRRTPEKQENFRENVIIAFLFPT